MKRMSIFTAMVLCLIFSIVSCQGNKSTKKEEKDKDGIKTEETGAAKTYQIGEKFALNNIQWEVVSANKLEEIPRESKDFDSGDNGSYKSEKGLFLVVNFKLKGSANNKPGGYDIDVIRVVEEGGTEYENIEPSGAIDNYRQQTKISNLSFAMVNREEEKEYMEIYDIAKTAKGLKLIWFGYNQAEKVVPQAEVDLGL